MIFFENNFPENNMIDSLKKIKIIHSLIWAILAFMTFYILYSGISGNITVFTWIAVGAIILEGLILLMNGWSCPLTSKARKYKITDKENFDIYLPEWLAKYNKFIFTTIFVIGLLLIIFRLV
jgi:hypothetical protein